MKVLEIKNVTKIYNESEIQVNAVNEVTLDFQEAEFAANTGKLIRWRRIGDSSMIFMVPLLRTLKSGMSAHAAGSETEKGSRNSHEIGLQAIAGIGLI